MNRLQMWRHQVTMLGRHYATSHPMVNPARYEKILQAKRREKELELAERDFMAFFENNIKQIIKGISLYGDTKDFDSLLAYYFYLGDIHYSKKEKAEKSRYFKETLKDTWKQAKIPWDSKVRTGPTKSTVLAVIGFGFFILAFLFGFAGNESAAGVTAALALLFFLPAGLDAIFRPD